MRRKNQIKVHIITVHLVAIQRERMIVVNQPWMRRARARTKTIQQQILISVSLVRPITVINTNHVPV